VESIHQLETCWIGKVLNTAKVLKKPLSFYAGFIKPRKIWQLPPKVEVLIFDREGSQILMQFLQSYKVSVLDIRRETINIPCFMRSVFNIDFWHGRAMQSYIQSFILLASPKIVITFIDNNYLFYEISAKFPLIKTIMIQNGLRGILGDIFGTTNKNDSFYVDYMFVFGEAIGTRYSELVKGEIIPIGSFRNNFKPISKYYTKNSCLFISQWQVKISSGVNYVDGGGISVTWDEFYSAEAKVLEFLDNWCFGNGMQLNISGRSVSHKDQEKMFFAQYLTKCCWKFFDKEDTDDIYSQIDSAEIVVSIDSTVSLESLSRNKRTAIFSIREHFIKSTAQRFGWPLDLPVTGSFWTNSIDEIDFQNIMNYLQNISDEAWITESEKYKTDLIQYDLNNSRISNLLNSILDRG
jgi:surface carbohydrate biosynthesis protein